MASRFAPLTPECAPFANNPATHSGASPNLHANISLGGIHEKLVRR
jgi:hypothetical protein